MKIVLFHPVHLPPADYGGVERVVLWLAEGLRDLGHSVWIAAREGSRLPAGVNLISIPKEEHSAESLLARLPPGTDIVHFQAPPEEGFLRRAAVPSVTTIHGNGKPGEVFPKNTVFLSRDHASRHGRSAYVHNGVNPGEFHLSAAKRKNSPLFLSKTSWRVKNLAGALRIADHAKQRLTVAGGHRPIGLHLRTFFSKHTWAGPVAGEKKSRLLADASALLFPVIWPEPFGLVMVEALLSGTPVVGSRLGSIPEVLGDFGGAVLDPTAPLEAWAEALREVQKLEPERLRETAIKRYSNLRMAADYVRIYGRVQQGEDLV